MAFDISTFRSNLQYDGARPTMFEINWTNPVDNSAALKIPTMVKAASLPAWQIGDIPVMYFGRAIHIAGDRTFDPWNTMVINDEDFLIRDTLENWSNSINTLKSNVRLFATSASSQYTSSATVTQYNKEGVPIRSYKFLNMWPRLVGPIELAWEAQNQVEQFAVVWMYDWFEPTQPTITGNAGGTF
jgi:hypothetical protein